MVSKNVFPELARAMRGAESETRSIIKKLIFKKLVFKLANLGSPEGDERVQLVLKNFLAFTFAFYLFIRNTESDLTLQVESRTSRASTTMGIELKTEILSLINQLATKAPFNPAQAARNLNSKPDFSQIARLIDHTLLKPETTRGDIQRICKEAIENRFATVCVNSAHIAEAAALLQGSSTLPISVIGFPLGACTTSTKVFETREAIRLGAREIDMVIPVGALKEENYAYVLNDIYEVVQAARPYPVKVILETSLLDTRQKVAACVLAKEAGAAFVKTSTGFGGGGATVEDIALMRAVVGPILGVKASGGVRTREDAEKMIAAGANRIGTSSGPAIVSTGKTPSLINNGY